MTIIPTAFAKMILDLAGQIQQIPAPTFSEGKRAEFMAQYFRELGLKDVQIDPTGNVLARLPGISAAEKPLVVSAHLDTVHPHGTPLPLTRSADRLVGPSIGDNSLGLAALLALPMWLRDQSIRLPGDLWLAANVGEEGLGDLNGMQAVVERFGGLALAYLVIEGIGFGNVLHRGLSVERYKVVVDTPGGHSWSDYGEPSAIHILCALVARLADIPLSKNPCTTLNVGVIQGGTSINSIAAQAWMELDLRSEDGMRLTHLVSQVHRIVHDAQRNNARVTIQRVGKRPAGTLPVSHPLVRLACDVLEDLNVQPRLDIASTDSNLPLSRGYPSVCIGITHGNNAHAADEFILTAPTSQGLAQLVDIVTRAWKSLR
jgi:tripeptide aminopeptidase